MPVARRSFLVTAAAKARGRIGSGMGTFSGPGILPDGSYGYFDWYPTGMTTCSTDQQRADTVGAYGSRLAATPNLDRLAATGVRFDACRTQNPYCQPSRATILTGRYPSRHGVYSNGVDFPQEDVGTTLSALLGAAGWTTAFRGKAHFASTYPRTPTGALESVEGSAAMPEGWGGPYMGFGDVDLTVPAREPEEFERKPSFHREWANGLPEPMAWANPGGARLSDRQLAEMMAGYYGMVAQLDHALGRVLRALDETGQTEDTLVIVTTDHGELRGDHQMLSKGPLHYDGLLPVPLRAPGPGRAPSLAASRPVSRVGRVPT